MRLKQISVFLENTPGHLEDVCKALAEAGVNLLTITIAETKEYGIVRGAESCQKNVGYSGVWSWLDHPFADYADHCTDSEIV